MLDVFTERQQAHAQDFQRYMQAIYASVRSFDTPLLPALPLAERLTQAIDDLEQIRAALPNPVSQGKVLAALHILRSVLEAP